LACGQDIGHRRRWRRLGDLLVPGLRQRRQVGLGLSNNERCGDEIAGLLAREQRIVVDRKRHRHPLHEAFDVPVLDDDFAPLRAHGEDLALQFELTEVCVRRPAA